MLALANRISSIDLVGPIRHALEKRFGIGELDKIMDWMLLGQPSASGVLVDERSALTLSTAWACTNAISSDIASLPLNVYRETENGKELAKNHYLYPILHDQFNPEMTAHEGRQMMQAWVLNWGNAYAYIDWDNAQRVRGLYPLSPDRVRARRDNTRDPISYGYKLPTGLTVPIASEDILHLRGLGNDGVLGYSVVTMARNSLGAAMATEQFAGTLFKNGIKPSCVITIKENLSDEAYKRQAAAIQEAYAGVGNAHKAMILEGGGTFQPMSMKPDDAQFLETRKWGVEDVCRWYDVPPMRIGHSDKASTYASAQTFFDMYLQCSLTTWLDLWEQTINAKLLYRNRGYLAKHDTKAFKRADLKALAEFYRDMTNAGIMMYNEVRDELDLNRYPAGEVFARPLNTAYIKPDQQEVPQATPAQPKPNGAPAPPTRSSYGITTH